MTCGNFKHLPRLKTSDKVLRDKTFNIAKTSKYDGYKRRPASMVYKFPEKKAGAVTGAPSETLATQDKSAIKSQIIQN